MGRLSSNSGLTYIEEDTTEYDESTGLPKLPRGYFWRVGRKDKDGDYCLYLLRGIFPFCYSVKHTWIYGPLTKDKVKKKALEVFKAWTRDQESKSLVGNYPPNKLK